MRSAALGSFARWVISHRRRVAVGWLLLMIAGGVAAGPATRRMSWEFSLPGQPGWEVSKQIVARYGNGGGQPPVVVVATLPRGQRVTDHAVRQRVGRAFAAVQRRLPQARVLAGRGFNTRDGRTAYALVFLPPLKGFERPYAQPVTEVMRASLPEGSSIRLTGLQELTTTGTSAGPGVLAETVLGGLGALAVLAFVFASVLAVVPLLVSATSILTTFLVLLGLTTFTEVSFVVEYVVALVGLGVAIDYSLLIVTRWREECARGRSAEEAVVAAIETAGRAVLVSGSTVAVGLCALIFLPVPSLRSVGYGGLLIPVFSVLVSLTLLPALLAELGRTGDWPHVRHEQHASRGWTRWTAFVIRRRWVAAGLATAILVSLCLPALSIRVGIARSDSLAPRGPAHDALKVLERGGVPDGVLTPLEVLVSGGHPDAVAARAGRVGEVAFAVAPTGPVWRRGNSAIVEIVPGAETSAGQNIDVVGEVRAALAHEPGVVGVTGAGAIQLDYVHAVYDSFPLMLGVIVLLSYVLLVRAFRSLLLALKAVLLNLVSVMATLGAMVVFWQDGHGSQSVFGLPATGAITFYVPLLTFAFLFGLSMDYEVFILARLREEYDRTGSTSRAVVKGIGRVGRLVTSAGLILFFAFAALTASPQTDIKMFATALAFGILLDATVIRALLVPSIVSLFGRWNWWLPAWAARPLRVEPSPARSAAAVAGAIPSPATSR
jgi:putative drug exporter of the RND superfamily